MSWTEYTDMFYEAQSADVSPYKMYLFDIKDSSGIRAWDGDGVHCLFNTWTAELADEGVLLAIPQEDELQASSLYHNCYFALGDCFGFCVDSAGELHDNEVVVRFEEMKERFDIDYEFHFASSYFQTFDWAYGNELYAFSYCVCQTEHLAKTEYGRII